VNDRWEDEYDTFVLGKGEKDMSKLWSREDDHDQMVEERERLIKEQNMSQQSDIPYDALSAVRGINGLEKELLAAIGVQTSWGKNQLENLIKHITTDLRDRVCSEHNAV
jgi:hypothetical protein